MAGNLETIIVRRDPRRHRIRIAGTVLVAGLMLLGSYGVGRWHAGSESAQISVALVENEARLASLAAEHAELQLRASNLQVGAEVDRQSMEQLRETISRQHRKAAQLREEIGFYKGLMAPTEAERGLGIRSWEVYALPAPRHYRFKLTVQQLAVKHSVLQGNVSVEIAGRGPDGSDSVLSLHELATEYDQPELKLRFRYFQHIEGELWLPEGFQPQRVGVVANASRPRAARVERQFSWQVLD